MLKLLHLAAIAGWLLSLFSCRPSDTVSPVDGKDSVMIYTTGSTLDPKTRQYAAVYWEQGKIRRLESGSALETGCYGLQKEGHDLYIAGYYVDDADERMKPCYWKNGRKIDLPIPPKADYARAGARDIHFFQGIGYILGDIDLRPVLWKLNANSSPQLLLLNGGTNAIRGEELSTGNLMSYQDQLYIGGIQTLPLNGRSVSRPIYWTVDKNDSIRVREVDSAPVKSLVFAILPSKQGVFSVGEVNDQFDRSAPVPTIWKNNNRFQLSQSVNPASQRLHELAMDSQGQLYLNILDYQRFLPIIWRIGPTGTVTEMLQPLPANASQAFCQNLAICNDTMYSSGTYKLNGLYHACIWHDNQRTELETLDGSFLTLSRMTVVSLP
ncbi:hypothetical protein [Spirosoma panaciterrae]|uniref:hypothetical protein n=1 Tax=Spirosoma panaciterrae TaxID=496058 RepID=UPI00037F2D04|nr:hypothetical protein [Spirosoma panaciterrae]